MLDLHIKKTTRTSQGVTRKTLRSQVRLGMRMLARLAAFGAGRAAKDWENHLFSEGDRDTYESGVYILAKMVPTAGGNDFELGRLTLFGEGSKEAAAQKYIAALNVILDETKTEAPPEPDEEEEDDEDDDAAVIE